MIFNRLSGLRVKSQRAISVFTDTLTDLRNINQDIQIEIDKNIEKVKVIQEENTEYTKVFTENNNIITKIQNILK